MPLRNFYGVSDVKVNRFVEENEAVKESLGKYRRRTAEENSYDLCRFLKWFRVAKDLGFSARATRCPPKNFPCPACAHIHKI